MIPLNQLLLYNFPFLIFHNLSLSLLIFQKGQIAKVRFSLNKIEKPVNSLFIGTSPELELALYTLCFELRADQECRLAYGGKDFNIVTHTYKYRGKNLIGSAYPEI